MDRLEFLQVCLGGGGVTVAGAVDRAENQVGNASDRGNDHDHTVRLCGLADDLGTLPETRSVAHRRSTKLHYEKTLLTAHDGLSAFWSTLPDRSAKGTASRVTQAPSLSAEVNNAWLETPTSEKIPCRALASSTSWALTNAITDEPDPLSAT